MTKQAYCDKIPVNRYSSMGIHIFAVILSSFMTNPLFLFAMGVSGWKLVILFVVVCQIGKLKGRIIHLDP
jgi:hypothetical protein